MSYNLFLFCPHTNTPNPNDPEFIDSQIEFINLEKGLHLQQINYAFRSVQPIGYYPGANFGGLHDSFVNFLETRDVNLPILVAIICHGDNPSGNPSDHLLGNEFTWTPQKFIDGHESQNSTLFGIASILNQFRQRRQAVTQVIKIIAVQCHGREFAIQANNYLEQNHNALVNQVEFHGLGFDETEYHVAEQGHIFIPRLRRWLQQTYHINDPTYIR